MYIYIYIYVCMYVCMYVVYLNSKPLFKHVLLKTAEYFRFGIFK